MTKARTLPSILSVRLHGRQIGTLTNLGGDRMLFAFDEAYIEDAERTTLSLGFKDAYGALTTEFPVTQTRAHPFFSNLLPEGHLRTYLAERANVNPVREFALLEALGADLPGAISIAPAGGDPVSVDDQATDVTAAAGEQPFGFSLAGVQLKFSALLEARGGLTIPARGLGGDWIIKLPSREFEAVPENEFSMMTLAGLIGIDVPPIELVNLADVGNLPDGIGLGDNRIKGKAFAIARFDRGAEGARVHIEDFAQIFGVYPEEKYKRATMRQIARVIGIEAGNEAIAEFIRRLTFNVLIGNADMHIKNWSLIYPDQRKAALAPAYDFVSTIPYIRDENFALKFSRTKRFDEFNKDELTHLAAKAELPEKPILDTAIETAARFHEVWAQEKAHLPMSAEVRKAIEAHLQSVRGF